MDDLRFFAGAYGAALLVILLLIGAAARLQGSSRALLTRLEWLLVAKLFGIVLLLLMLMQADVHSGQSVATLIYGRF